MMFQLHRKSLKVVLKMHMKKTKVMLNNFIQKNLIKLHDNLIECAQNYIYLRYKIFSCSDHEKEIRK